MITLRCLSVRQPWATAILTLGKTIENRDWKTNYRGPLVIHASAKSEGPAREMFNGILSKAVCARLNDDDFALGAILGVVDLVNCVDWLYEEPYSPWADSGSLWYWILRNPRVLKRPIPCKGRLQLWDPPASAVEALRRLL